MPEKNKGVPEKNKNKSEKDRRLFVEASRNLMDFIGRSPSPFHVVENFENRLSGAGFERLEEQAEWNIETGKSYYVTRNASSLIAFRVPEEVHHFQIVAAHTDSPAFKVKEQAEISADAHYVTLNTEKYGGMLCAPWLDRPLSIAGRVVCRQGKEIVSKNIDFDRELVLIPSLAIHMNKDANTGFSYDAKKDMLPLLGSEFLKGKWKTMVAEEAGCEEKDILGTDLFLYNRVPGTFFGAEQEYISCGRLDDLQCAYAAMEALVESRCPGAVAMCALFDNEEVGSSTKQGAASTFLSDVMERIADCLSIGRQGFKQMSAGSILLSADNAHAVHPNHPELADSTNRPYMNEGIVIKYNASQKYTTDAVSAGIFKEICRMAQVPVQSYANRSDMAGGSTLGHIASQQVSIPMADIGLAQLAMHSPYETAGVKDTWYMMQALQQFYATNIEMAGDGAYRLDGH